MFKEWTVVIPIEKWSGDFLFYFFTVFVYWFFLNGYDLLTGNTCTRCTRAHPYYTQHYKSD
jgi:hypothetical protein